MKNFQLIGYESREFGVEYKWHICPINRVSSDQENLEFWCNEKITGKSHTAFNKTRKAREFCCVQFIFSQSEYHNFENFLGEHAPSQTLLTCSDTHKKLIVVWKSEGI